jgi:hypothetical protein
MGCLILISSTFWDISLLRREAMWTIWFSIHVFSALYRMVNLLYHYYICICLIEIVL